MRQCRRGSVQSCSRIRLPLRTQQPLRQQQQLQGAAGCRVQSWHTQRVSAAVAQRCIKRAAPRAAARARAVWCRAVRMRTGGGGCRGCCRRRCLGFPPAALALSWQMQWMRVYAGCGLHSCSV
eukprot:XP_001694389.1 predicted protein [Chlamydomonas reinhardtii]